MYTKQAYQLRRSRKSNALSWKEYFAKWKTYDWEFLNPFSSFANNFLNTSLYIYKRKWYCWKLEFSCLATQTGVVRSSPRLAKSHTARVAAHLSLLLWTFFSFDPSQCSLLFLLQAPMLHSCKASQLCWVKENKSTHLRNHIGKYWWAMSKTGSAHCAVTL